MTVTADDLDKLRHMVGVQGGAAKKDWGYRNYFAAGAGSVPAMERLVVAGYCTRGGRQGDLQYYHATEAGCAAAGLDEAATKRAMEDN
jgi:hypothetical protein